MTSDRLIAPVTGVSRKAGIAAAICSALSQGGWDVVGTVYRPNDASMPWGSHAEDPTELIEGLRECGGAIEWITYSCAGELAAKGITVNAVNPGPNDTGWMDEETATEVRRWSPMGRIGTPDDVAGLIAFLCSDAARWITGQVLM